ncbi:GrdX protein [Alkaliphilus pronyensis]|uniref:GrdX protein n=2 Tax=Alkaliphilus pronyensis TaxID=1482732 RepID=A0A6I0F6L8_9FIRM|nr:GrdX protein [Alkaliphilus pronyensis]
MVLEEYNSIYEVDFIEDSLMAVLLKTRDKIHEGHLLLSHPLSGSVKPNETIYKSVIFSKDKGKLDMDSLYIIESSIETARKFINTKKPPTWSNKTLVDFQEIDYTLITSGIESMTQFK